MFTMLLAVQWRRSWIMVALFALLLFAAPLLMLNPPGEDAAGAASYPVLGWLRASESLGRALPVGALALGLLAGLAVWADDQRGGHVYALTLPVRRDAYVVMRFGAALVLVLAPCVALLAGAVTAGSLTTLPPGIHAYPFALAARFTLATVSCLAVFFALGIATPRAARLMLVALLALAFAEIALRMVGGTIVGDLLESLLRWPSPFEVLGGRWALFDV